ncbi:hypothetical protein CQ10_38530 [Bradyrhizobium valentinum]|nr:hypothetical protein CQ10_38530 [Bradyrhizobium valentinum]
MLAARDFEFIATNDMIARWRSIASAITLQPDKLKMSSVMKRGATLRPGQLPTLTIDPDVKRVKYCLDERRVG